MNMGGIQNSGTSIAIAFPTGVGHSILFIRKF